MPICLLKASLLQRSWRIFKKLGCKWKLTRGRATASLRPSSQSSVYIGLAGRETSLETSPRIWDLNIVYSLLGLFFLSFGSHLSVLRQPDQLHRSTSRHTGVDMQGREGNTERSWGLNMYGVHLTILLEALCADLLREMRSDSAPCSTESLVPRRTSVIQTVTFTAHFLQEALRHPENEKNLSQLSSWR